MTLVKINLDNYNDTALGWRAKKGVELSHWCREHGLDIAIDYTWSFEHAINELHFEFKDAAFASFFALKWGGAR